jgi:rhodanese-related sulfurtransferase
VSRLDEFLTRISHHEKVLVLGTGTSEVATGLRALGIRLDVVAGDWPSIQLPRRFALVIVETADPADPAAVLHCAVQHLAPGGEVVLTVDDVDAIGDRFDLRETQRFDVEGVDVVRLARPDRVTIHDRVFAARSRIQRVTAPELAARLTEPDAPTVVDTRTATDRSRFGVIAGSIHVPRTVVEWHLDPANGYRHNDVTSFEQNLVLVCNGGYSSSLAAASLLDLGFSDVGDLIGGIRAWTEAGLELVEPDHSHLDL